jgi:hypothetical protein
MKIVYTFLGFVIFCLLFSCRPTKKINHVIQQKRDTVAVVMLNNDSILEANKISKNLADNKIKFNTFSAKIKVDYEDNSKGRTPDFVANLRIIKDSAIWMSVTATLVNYEVLRVLITKDSIFVMDKQNKEATLRPIEHLQTLTGLPFDYYTLQDLFLGNPTFFDSDNFLMRKTSNAYLVSSAGMYFKHLLTLDLNSYNIIHSKLDDVDPLRNRTADITYGEYEKYDNYNFATVREITISEKNRIDILMKYKSYEFNKELAISFKIPKNYKRK